ncbi:MAG: hypothetical protein ABJN46_05635, partial [Marinobacter sp.]
DPKQGKKAYVYGQHLPKHLLKSRPPACWPRLIELADSLPTRDKLSVEFPLPTLNDASDLVGMNGHLLMNNDRDVHLLRLVVDSFQLDENAYHAAIKRPKKNRERALGLLETGGFAPTKNTTLRLDTLDKNYSGDCEKATAYAGLIVAKPAIGTLRDSFELVLAFIAVAATYCPRPVPLTPWQRPPTDHSS